MELDFKPSSIEDWLQQIQKENKGQIPEGFLEFEIEEGIFISSIGNSEKFNQKIQVPNFSTESWQFAESIYDNQQLQEALKSGINNIQVNKSENLGELLKGLFFEMVDVSIATKKNPAKTLLFLKSVSKHGNIKVWHDPIAELIKNGSIKGEINHLKPDFISHFNEVSNSIPQAATITIDNYGIKVGGANQQQQLLSILGSLSEYLSWINDQNQIEKIKNIQVIVGISTQFFLEIAKLRSLKILLSNLLHAYGVSENIKITILAKTSSYQYTAFDYNNNILRATTQALSAVIGGATAIEITPFTVEEKLHTSFSHRVARNINHILKEESMMDKVFDMASGSYFLEELTQKLTSKGWQSFQKMEENSGFISKLVSNEFQKEVEKQHQKNLDRLASGKSILLGVNKYKNPKDKPLEISKTSEFSENQFAINPILPKRLAEIFEEELKNTKL